MDTQLIITSSESDTDSVSSALASKCATDVYWSWDMLLRTMDQRDTEWTFFELQQELT